MPAVSHYSRGVITLYRAPWSTNVERVALALAHKALDVESIVIDYADRGPVEAVSGQGLVPVIVDAGEVVADSAAIIRHLDARYPDPPLFGADPARRAELDIFIEWFNEVWKGAPNAIEAELGAAAPDAERIGALAARMDGWLDGFEHMLSGRDHLAGPEFSAADCIAFPFLKYARSRAAGDDELFHVILDEHQSCAGRPALAAWIERVDARPRAM
jgi:glutathione S-transferase